MIHGSVLVKETVEVEESVKVEKTVSCCKRSEGR